MKKLVLAALVLLAVAGAVQATTTWTAIKPPAGAAHVRAVKGANPTATGIEPAPVSTTAGLPLKGLEGVVVMVETCTGTPCTAAGGNMTAGGKLLAYVLNPTTGKWLPLPDLDLTVSATPTQAWSGIEVLADDGRLAFVPSGLGTTTNVYERGTTRYPSNR